MFKTRISEVVSQLPPTADSLRDAEVALEMATAFSVELTFKAPIAAATFNGVTVQNSC